MANVWALRASEKQHHNTTDMNENYYAKAKRKTNTEYSDKFATTKKKIKQQHTQ